MTGKGETVVLFVFIIVACLLTDEKEITNGSYHTISSVEKVEDVTDQYTINISNMVYTTQSQHPLHVGQKVRVDSVRGNNIFLATQEAIDNNLLEEVNSNRRH